MTLSHAASMLSAIWTLACGLLFISTGSLTWGLMVLAAPLPMQLARISDRETWSVGEALRGRRDDHGVSDALDQSLRDPLPTPRFEDDGSFFVPDCPVLEAPPAAPRRPTGPPASTPLR